MHRKKGIAPQKQEKIGDGLFKGANDVGFPDPVQVQYFKTVVLSIDGCILKFLYSSMLFFPQGRNFLDATQDFFFPHYSKNSIWHIIFS